MMIAVRFVAMPLCFKFEGGMRNALLRKSGFDALLGIFHIGNITDNNVRRKCIFGGADSPYM